MDDQALTTILLRDTSLTREGLEMALQSQSQEGTPLAEILRRDNVLPEEELARAQAMQLGLEYISKLEPEDVAAIAAQLEAAWYRLEGEALDWLLDLGAELSDEQVQDFLGELQEQQSEYEKKYLKRSEEDFRGDSYDSLLDSMQDYLGRLDSEQRVVLREASEGLMRSDRTWLTERAAWLQRLGVMMQREPGWQQRIRDASAAKNETVSAEYLSIYEHNTRLIYRAVADTLNSRSNKQDRRLRGKLDDLQEDLQTLIAQGASLEH